LISNEYYDFVIFIYFFYLLYEFMELESTKDHFVTGEDAEILKTLSIISKIRSNQKLCMNTKKIVSAGIGYGSIHRFLNNENRKNDIYRIEKCIEKALDILMKSEYERAIIFAFHLKKAIIGLKNMKDIYHDDADYGSSIDIILTNIDSVLKKYEKMIIK